MQIEWQPIETAPKDGTRILAAVSYGVTIVRWGISEPFGDGKAWCTDSEGPGYSSEFDDREISGWLPLPEPPPLGP